MTSREEVAKVRKELQATERALAMQERNEIKPDRNMGPVGLPSAETHHNPESQTKDLDYVVHLPPKKKHRTENKW
jgi:hypothetical protein